MAKVWVGPVGRLIEGHVLDVSKRGLLEALRLYDPQLYVKWNPKKLRGHGCWEIRRHPNEKSIKAQYVFHGNTYTVVDYVENPLVHHVYDAAFLTYNVIEKIKSMDTWAESYKGKEWARELEYKSAKHDERLDEKAYTERQYQLKQLKPLIKEFKEYVLSGHNPARIADHWK